MSANDNDHDDDVHDKCDWRYNLFRGWGAKATWKSITRP